MAPPVSALLMSQMRVTPFSAAVSSMRMSMSAVARASCTARWAFLRLMPSDLHTAPRRWLLRLGYMRRENSSVSMTGMCTSMPSRLHSSMRKDESNFALCAANAAPPMNSSSFGISVSAVPASATMASVMPVSLTTSSGIGSCGLTKREYSSTTCPLRMRTAPISMMRFLRGLRPVVSKSTTTISSVSARSSASVTTVVTSVR